MYKIEQYQTITERLREKRKFIQVIMGPRQVGKTTVVKQVLQALDAEISYLMFSADNVPATQKSWISDSRLFCLAHLAFYYKKGLPIHSQGASKP